MEGGTVERYSCKNHCFCCDSSQDFQLSQEIARRIHALVEDLESNAADLQRRAATEIRHMARSDAENRVEIVRGGALAPLISLISSSDPQIQEQSVTAILNLSLRDDIRDQIAAAGAIQPLIRALRTGTSTARENAACALLRLSQIEEQGLAMEIGDAIPWLVELLATGTLRGKKDASAALYSVCSTMENKVRAVRSGIVRPLVEMVGNSESGMVDKAAFLLCSLVVFFEAAEAVVEEGGVGVLVEVLEVGSRKQKEMAATVLLQICEQSVGYRPVVGREGAIPPLVALSQSGTAKARKKAETLIRLLRLARGGNSI
ncbi:U-box domain-containing protein 11-like [Wolffia australiana]